VSDPRVVSVDIRGQHYPIRSTLDPRYVSDLANYVNEKMRVAAESAPGEDALRLAVLAALNIADELFRCQQAQRTNRGLLAERAEELERLLDQVLASCASP